VQGRKRVTILNHIQKCAGTSLSTYVFRSLGCRESAQLYMLSTIDDFYPKWRRGHYRDVESIYVGSHFAAQVHTLFPEHEPQYLTMLREPLARFLSSYKMSMDIGTLPASFTPAEYFEGAWPNYLTLAIGDGSLREAKRRLAEEYRFVGITEEFERSSQLLAHSFDFPTVGLLHANRSVARVSEQESVSPELKERFTRANADDLELYRFARTLFEERWRAAEPAIVAASRPLVAEESKLDVREFLNAYVYDVGGKDSFIFAPWSSGDAPLTIFWGVLYRTGFIPLCFRLLEQARFEELRIVLANLRRFHEHTPYAQPVLGRCIEFFERGVRAGATSRLSRSALGSEVPVLSVDYVAFMDTDRMLRLGRALRDTEDLKAKIENALRNE
jgi:hypothetical protein